MAECTFFTRFCSRFFPPSFRRFAFYFLAILFSPVHRGGWQGGFVRPPSGFMRRSFYFFFIYFFSLCLFSVFCAGCDTRVYVHFVVFPRAVVQLSYFGAFSWIFWLCRAAAGVGFYWRRSFFILHRNDFAELFACFRDET